jgi:hypothetical protein
MWVVYFTARNLTEEHLYFGRKTGLNYVCQCTQRVERSCRNATWVKCNQHCDVTAGRHLTDTKVFLYFIIKRLP